MYVLPWYVVALWKSIKRQAQKRNKGEWTSEAHKGGKDPGGALVKVTDRLHSSGVIWTTELVCPELRIEQKTRKDGMRSGELFMAEPLLQDHVVFEGARR